MVSGTLFPLTHRYLGIFVHTCMDASPLLCFCTHLDTLIHREALALVSTNLTGEEFIQFLAVV